jgi:hypothetical protein
LAQRRRSNRSNLVKPGQTLRAQGEKCDPHIYYHRVRTPMSGWRGNPALPGGLVYEGVSREPLQLYGETGAQSSIVAALDAALGVEHECGWCAGLAAAAWGRLFGLLFDWPVAGSPSCRCGRRLAGPTHSAVLAVFRPPPA